MRKETPLPRGVWALGCGQAGTWHPMPQESPHISTENPLGPLTDPHSPPHTATPRPVSPGLGVGPKPNHAVAQGTASAQRATGEQEGKGTPGEEGGGPNLPPRGDQGPLPLGLRCWQHQAADSPWPCSSWAAVVLTPVFCRSTFCSLRGPHPISGSPLPRTPTSVPGASQLGWSRFKGHSCPLGSSSRFP